MGNMYKIKAYEAEHGPHFNADYAKLAVSNMSNEDGTSGPHWSIEETTTLASQYGIPLNRKFNRYDWYVVLNMIYSDFYKAIRNIAGSATGTKAFVEFAKAWLNDSDITEGKAWYYYLYVMCNKLREALTESYDEYDEEPMYYRRKRPRKYYDEELY